MVNCIIVNMPTTIRSFVRENLDDTHTIVINARLSHEEQCEAYIHEMNHILYGDMHAEMTTGQLERRMHEKSRDLYPGIHR